MFCLTSKLKGLQGYFLLTRNQKIISFSTTKEKEKPQPWKIITNTDIIGNMKE